MIGQNGGWIWGRRQATFLKRRHLAETKILQGPALSQVFHLAKP